MPSALLAPLQLLPRFHLPLFRPPTCAFFFRLQCHRRRLFIARSSSSPPNSFSLVHHHHRSFSTCPPSHPSQPSRLLSVLFYGSDDFSLESLRLLRGKLLQVNNQEESVIKRPTELTSTKTALSRLEVVTTSSGNPVYNYCKRTGLVCHSFDRFPFAEHRFDLGVVSSFGRLIPKAAIEACRYGILNIHGSLLPRWRGASPIQHAILAGDSVTGLTIMRIKPKKFDIGEIVAQRPIDILHRVTAADLKRMMAPLGAQLLWECLENLEQALAGATEQPSEGVTMAPKLTEADGELLWATMNAAEVDRRVRAFTGVSGFSGCYTHWIDGTPLKLSEVVDPDLVARLELSQLAAVGEGDDHLDHHIPGLLLYHRRRHLLAIASADRTWSAFRSFTLKGRKRMSALGFYNTFIRPLAKAYRAVHGGQKPAFILGRQPIIATAVWPLEQQQQMMSVGSRSQHFVGVHNFDELQQISAKLKL